MVAPTGGIAGFAIVDEFLEQANQKQAHADRLAKRIVQLVSEPEFDPFFATPDHSSSWTRARGSARVRAIWRTARRFS